MCDKQRGFFEGTEMPTAGWWEALWPDPASVLVRIALDVVFRAPGQYRQRSNARLAADDARHK